MTDAELVEATRVMYQHGFVCETSGCASVAAVIRFIIELYKNFFIYIIHSLNKLTHQISLSLNCNAIIVISGDDWESQTRTWWKSYMFSYW